MTIHPIKPINKNGNFYEKIFAVVLVVTLIVMLLVGCGGKIDARSGCRVLREHNNNVTYQTVCDHCGYEFGDPILRLDRTPWSSKRYNRRE